LDEATNQLDSGTEAEVLGTLYEMRHGRTIVMVAHDLSAARHADRIVVMDAGRIVEDGSHELLLKKKGQYAALWRAQQAGQG